MRMPFSLPEMQPGRQMPLRAPTRQQNALEVIGGLSPQEQIQRGYALSQLTGSPTQRETQVVVTIPEIPSDPGLVTDATSAQNAFINPLSKPAVQAGAMHWAVPLTASSIEGIHTMDSFASTMTMQIRSDQELAYLTPGSGHLTQDMVIDSNDPTGSLESIPTSQPPKN